LPGIVLLFACSLPVSAQDAATAEPTFPSPAGEGQGIAFGARASGSIDDASTRQVYVFDGLRGDLLSIAVDVTEGDLAPVVTLMSPQGDVLASSDAAAPIRLEGVSLPASGAYALVIARFGGSVGTTSGRFALSLDRTGASASTGSGLRYGDSVIGEIDATSPVYYYTFRGERGDVLTVQMRRLSGNLDSMLQVTDATGRIIAENDEILGSGSLDAAIDNLVIEQTGPYVVIAQRFGGQAGDSVGDFLLTIDTAANSALGTSALLALPIEAGVPLEGTLTDERYAQFYRFEGRRDDVISVRMNRTGGNLDTLVAIADASLRELTFNDDSNGSQNSAIENYVLPADGVYYLIATRFERADGQTTGDYSIVWENQGSVFANVIEGALRITYGSTVAGFVDDLAPEALYAFQGQAGDAITVAMSRVDGTLDPFISILDENRNVLASDDDGAGQQNARIDRFTLPATGVYYIRASRYQDASGGQGTSGSYLLVLAQRFD
jgi:hypothetical protein